MAPPQTTILIQGVKDIPSGSTSQGWLVGLDLQFFSVSKSFFGLKNIPAGIHVFHYSGPPSTGTSDPVVDLTSVRQGFWFECSEGDVIVLRWDPKDEKFIRIFQDDMEDNADGIQSLDYSKSLSELGNLYQHMADFEQVISNKADLSLWDEQLTNHIDFDDISVLLNSRQHEISSTMASRQENDLLRKVLRERSQSRQEQTIKDDSLKEDLDNQPQINYTPINFKVKRSEAGGTVEEVTANYLDKSWYVGEIFADRELLISELQVSFINYIVFGNYCSMVQWIQLLKLMSMSGSLLLSSKSFTLNFLKVFKAQLTKLPKEYLTDDVSDQCSIDLAVYTEIIENYMEVFKDWDSKLCCGKLKLQGLIKSAWDGILKLHADQFGLDFNALESKKSDIFDRDDEDGPVIVAYTQDTRDI